MSVHQKKDIILESKMVQKLSLEKNGLLNWYSNEDFFFEKMQLIWHRKLDLKVQFWHFLTNRNLSTGFFFKFFLWVSWFLAKHLAFKDPLSLNFHDRTDINSYLLLQKDLLFLVFENKKMNYFRTWIFFIVVILWWLLISIALVDGCFFFCG